MEEHTFVLYTGKPTTNEEYKITISNQQEHKLSFDTTPKDNVRITTKRGDTFTSILIPENALRWAFASLETTLADDIEAIFYRSYERIKPQLDNLDSEYSPAANVKGS